MYSIGIFLFIALTITSLAFAQGPAATTPTIKKCKQIFRAGVVFNEPLYFVSPQRQIRGSSLEVIHELRKRTGCDFAVEEFNRPALIEKFRRSQIDISVITVKALEMDNVAQFLHLYSSPRGFVYNQSLNPRIKTLKAALANKKIKFGNIISTQTYYSLPEFELLRKSKRIVDFPDYSSLFAALESGRIHAFVGSLMVSSYYLKKTELAHYNIVIDEDYFVPIGCYIDPRRLGEEEIRILKQTFAAMLRDGTFVKIYSQYSPHELAKRSIIPAEL